MLTTEVENVEHAANLARRLAIRNRLFEIHPFCCLCHQRISYRKRVTLDHIIPLSRGGGDDVGNLELCCRKCNRFKSDRTPSEFVAVLEMILDNARLRVEGGVA